jgi:CRISPR-associated protein Csb2
VGDWPPSPFRLFQALVAGAYGGRWAIEDSDQKDEVFQWFECLDPPLIAAPRRALTRAVTYYVPNNDRDAVDGDPRRVGTIRTAKEVRASLLEDDWPTFLYAFEFQKGDEFARRLCVYAERLHALGRGVDAAFAKGALIGADEVPAALRAHGGVISTPSGFGGEGASPCPTDGSLESLKRRYRATTRRLETTGYGRRQSSLYKQPPAARFRSVVYDRAPTRFFYALRRSDDPAHFAPEPQANTMLLTERLRDLATRRFSGSAPPSLRNLAERWIGGRGEPPDPARRVRILPLPTRSGFNSAIRRVMVEVPTDCPLSPADVDWAFTGLDPDKTPDEGVGTRLLSPFREDSTTRGYGFGSGARTSRTWRSVTPLALPGQMSRGRVDGARRAAEEVGAVASIADALRHSGLGVRARHIRLQREPFEARGTRSDDFVAGRFEGRLRHAEIVFDRPIRGPVILGDARFVGLGLMAPVDQSSPTTFVFALEPHTAPPPTRAYPILRAFRRAVMSRAAAGLPRGGSLPALFHGHEADGAPLRRGVHNHLFYAAWSACGDTIDRVALFAPQRVDRSLRTQRELSSLDEHLANLAEALLSLREVHAGSDGVLRLTLIDETADEGPLGASTLWTSVTPYRPTRHPKRSDPGAAIISDVYVECARRALPAPKVEVVDLVHGPRGGLAAHLRLTFAVAVRGPLLLGDGSHFGAGLFRPS